MSGNEVIPLIVILTTCLTLNTFAVPIPTSTFTRNGNPNQTKIISHFPQGDPLRHKENQTLSCSATSGSPVAWQWLRNGKNIRAYDGYFHGKSDDNTNRSNQVMNITLLPVTDIESNYTCVAVNEFGSDSYTFTIHEERNWTKEIIIGLSISLGILLVGMGLLMIYYRLRPREPLKKLEQEQIDTFYHGDGQPSEEGDGIELVTTSVSNFRYDCSKEIKMKSLIFGRYIGGGISGRVEAVIVVNWPEEGVHKHGAAKSIRKDRSMKPEQFEWAFLDFIHKEIKITQLVGSFRPHENVVGYIGSVVEDLANYKAYLIVEYCSGGDLASLLRKHREQGTFFDDINEPGLESDHEEGAALKTSHLVKWAEQIAAGLEHLASLNIPHMDLAIRNILLAHEDPELNSERYLDPDPANLIAKISDLGMARELNRDGSTSYRFYNPDEPERNGRARWLPFRWMAVEALETFTCTLETDIWSLGVTFWEMFTLGGFPYEEELQVGPGIPEELRPHYERLQLIEYFRRGRILPEPSHVPPQIWDIMKECWNQRPEERPSPRFIREELHQLNEDIREQLQNRSTDASSSSSGNAGVTYVQVYSMEQGEEQPRYMNTEAVQV